MIQETCILPLTQNKVAIVDKDDYKFISQFNWYVIKHGRTFYAGRCSSRKADPNGKQHTILLHNVIMNPLEGYEIDHIDGNGLNN